MIHSVKIGDRLFDYEMISNFFLKRLVHFKWYQFCLSPCINIYLLSSFLFWFIDSVPKCFGGVTDRLNANLRKEKILSAVFNVEFVGRIMHLLNSILQRFILFGVSFFGICYDVCFLGLVFLVSVMMYAFLLALV